MLPRRALGVVKHHTAAPRAVTAAAAGPSQTASDTRWHGHAARRVAQRAIHRDGQTRRTPAAFTSAGLWPVGRGLGGACQIHVRGRATRVISCMRARTHTPRPVPVRVRDWSGESRCDSVGVGVAKPLASGCPFLVHRFNAARYGTVGWLPTRGAGARVAMVPYHACTQFCTEGNGRTDRTPAGMHLRRKAATPSRSTGVK